MKKIIILIITIVAIWFASLFYASATTESKARNYAEKINEFYKQQQLGFEVKLSKFESSLFGAKMQYKINVNPYEMLGIPKDLMEEDKSFKQLSKVFNKPIFISQDIKYGPIFFGEGVEFGMAKFGFESKLTDIARLIATSINARVDEKDKESSEKIEKIITEIKNFTKNDIVIKYQSILPYFSNNMTFNGSVSEINIHSKKIGSQFKMDKVIMNGEANIDDLTGKLNTTFPRIVFIEGGLQKANIENLTLDYNINEFIDAYNYFGEFDFKAQKVTIPIDGDNMSFGVGITSVVSKNQTKELSDINFNLNLEVLEYPKTASQLPFDLPKNIGLKFGLNGINMSALSKLAKEFKLNINNLTNDEDGFKEFIKSVPSKAEYIFVKDKTKFLVKAELKTKNFPKFNNFVGVEVVYKFAKGDFKKLINANKTDRVAILKTKFDAFLSANLNAESLKAVEMFLAMPIQMGAIIKDGNVYKSDIKYQNSKLIVNDKDLTPMLDSI
jgi:hypothetical protein